MDPERYLKDTCEWLYGSLGRIRKKEGDGIYSASSYEKRLRKASARASERLGLEDGRVFEHVIHWVMADCGMEYSAKLDSMDGTNSSTVDMRRFDPELLERGVAKYNKPGKCTVFIPVQLEGREIEQPGHIDARYRTAWEDENPGEPLSRLPVAGSAKRPLPEPGPEPVQLTA